MEYWWFVIPFHHSLSTFSFQLFILHPVIVVPFLSLNFVIYNLFNHLSIVNYHRITLLDYSPGLDSIFSSFASSLNLIEQGLRYSFDLVPTKRLLT